jgi:hypothetical protein
MGLRSPPAQGWCGPVKASGKRCPRCGKVRSPQAFYRRRNGGLSGYCRSCQRAVSRAARERRYEDPAELARMRAADRARKRRRRGEATGPSPQGVRAGDDHS